MPAIGRVLIANRGEIAVRVVRGCRDLGIHPIAVYADQDRNAQYVRLADEAFALDGASPADTYLDIDKLLAIAKRAEVDGIHPGYGFLAENAEFAEAVIGAGITWIGPPPAAIRSLGAKTDARKIAERVGAPLAPGLSDPVASAEEIEAFAREHGLPVLIKAVYGGGGRGMKVVREAAEIPEAFDAAVRESTAAFGRGECFVERFLDRARHVETQCLADRNGKVVVVSTRDCSLQRRNQKLVEEAPAPFLTSEQVRRVYDASKAILAEVGYQGAGTCEFLVASDGTISFNEVNTRLQVEHPVSELVTGIDLVTEQLRLASGGLLEYDDPPVRGHAMEFRINGEDAGRNFLPTPGLLTSWRPPSGPGIRWDGGVEEGDTLPDAFDSLLGKLIVYGSDRTQVLARARRALAEFTVVGVATVLPFDRAIVDDPAFIGPLFTVHTRWIESEFRTTIPPATEPATSPDAPESRTPLVVEVNGRRMTVSLPDTFSTAFTASSPVTAHPPSRRHDSSPTTMSSDGAVVAPMQGKVVKLAVAEGQQVSQGDQIIVVEAMKMEQALNAGRAGLVSDLIVGVGDSVKSGQVLCRIVDGGSS